MKTPEQAVDGKPRSTISRFSTPADEQADAGAVEHRVHRDEDNEAEQEGEDAVDPDRDVADDHRPGEDGGSGDLDRHAAPDDEQLLGDDQRAHGDQIMQVILVDRLYDDPPEEPAGDGAEGGGGGDRRHQRDDKHNRAVAGDRSKVPPVPRRR